MIKIAVIDGQGGGIGKSVIEKIKGTISWEYSILALGTNSNATALMLKAGANAGATGENAIVYNATRVDMIIGAIGIVAANSFHGELSPTMAKAVGESDALKILIPSNKCNLLVAGTRETMLAEYIDAAVKLLDQVATGQKVIDF
jgi:hypothetical protein